MTSTEGTNQEANPASLVERAAMLAHMGRSMEARADYLKALELDPTHQTGLLGLGRLLVNTGHRKAARVVYSELVKHYPDCVVSRVNLGSVLLEDDDPAGAREHYEQALRMEPQFPQAHGGMYYALSRLGEKEAAEVHRKQAFGQQNLFREPYRGKGTAIPVVMLVASSGGNIPIEKLLDNRTFETYIVVADFFGQQAELPPHRLVINGIGDSDISFAALEAAHSLLSKTSMPVLNAPAAVMASGRRNNALRMASLPGVKTPRTAHFPRALLVGDEGALALTQAGFEFPLLLRAPGFHMGQHFVKVDWPSELPGVVNDLPGTDLLAIQYLDAKGTDGWMRKYRVMMVGGQLFPLHLALSRSWKIHYFSADMAERSEHRAEEARFLNDMAGTLGQKGMTALQHIRTTLGLDYGGIDFGLSPEGDVLLFEANATMVVEQPNLDERWDYRRPAIQRIQDAVRQLLLRSAMPASAQVPTQLPRRG